MMEHEEAQQNSWKLSHCRTLAEKQNELAWLRRSVHDPLLFGGGLETNSVIGWRFLGELRIFFLVVILEILSRTCSAMF
jgi:hypothetical protein